MSEYFACRHNHIFRCLAHVKLLQFLMPAFAAVKTETIVSNLPPRWKVTSVHSMCHCQTNREVTDRSAPISADWDGIRTLERLYCFHSCGVFFLSFTDKNSFSCLLPASQKIWDSTQRRSEVGKNIVALCLTYAQGSLELCNSSNSTSTFSF